MKINLKVVKVGRLRSPISDVLCSVNDVGQQVVTHIINEISRATCVKRWPTSDARSAQRIHLDSFESTRRVSLSINEHFVIGCLLNADVSSRHRQYFI